jgi:hypothetical protein
MTLLATHTYIHIYGGGAPKKKKIKKKSVLNQKYKAGLTID